MPPERESSFAMLFQPNWVIWGRMVTGDYSLTCCELSGCSIVELIYIYHHGWPSRSCLVSHRMLFATCFSKVLSILSKIVLSASKSGFQPIQKGDLASCKPGHRTDCASLVLFRAGSISNQSCIRTSLIFV